MVELVVLVVMQALAEQVVLVLWVLQVMQEVLLE
jgi:hypothetical protein